MKASWDIFCSVVDNYGDIGVTWRLARQLVAEHECEVRLWVDDLRAFEKICPQIDIRRECQQQAGVEVRQWPEHWLPVAAADVVIAAFACQLPHAYMEAMAERERPPLWLNLDYLSAEDWIGGCHGLPSVKFHGVQKYFFFPGFVPGTGGLLRESDLLRRRQAFQGDRQAQLEFLQGLGVAPLADARLMSLFAYENAGLDGWLDALADDVRPTHLLVPEGRILGDVQRWLDVAPLGAGDLAIRRSLTIQVLPFVPQEDYDRLLWCCDFNAVRGEDSFVRAQWAGRPMLWHIYRQDEDIHLDKLEAFLALYTRSLSPEARAAVLALWQAWNTESEMAQAWKNALQHWPQITAHAEQWSLEQGSQTDLAAALVQFYLNWI